MMTNIVSKATAPLPFLALACEAATRLGAIGVLILPEGPMDWDIVRVTCAREMAVMVASSSERQLESVRKAGLLAIEVEPTEVSISERITLALIEAVANDLLQAGARVVVVYSGFEAEALDSLTVIRLGEHLERLTARDLRALETSVPFETLKAVVDVGVEIGREGREGKAVGTLIVVGDARNVMSRTRQLGFDPFRGYTRKERNVRDFRGLCGGTRWDCRGGLPVDRRADDWTHVAQGAWDAALGGGGDYGCDEGGRGGDQSVERDGPAVSER
jgi:diadenylate cyclase